MSLQALQSGVQVWDSERQEGKAIGRAVMGGSGRPLGDHQIAASQVEVHPRAGVGKQVQADYIPVEVSGSGQVWRPEADDGNSG